MNPYVAIVLDLVLAAVLGGIIGVQRQATHKPAGFRTHVLVALGACAFMEISQLLHDTRVAAGVITGVGFLGAGAIVRDGRVPRGLTTAASIWVVAAIGLALGVGSPGAYVLAACTVLLAFGALSFTEKRIDDAFPAKQDLEVAVAFDAATLSLDDVISLFSQRGLRVKKTDRLAFEHSETALRGTWVLQVPAKHGRALRDVLAGVAATPGVLKIDSTELYST